ncbi:MAG: hypothetical protein JXB04_03665 [Kiritimatiellae bacterium]|nr:hypothetical protein [Kiritimatiellia bacterium]
MSCRCHSFVWLSGLLLLAASALAEQKEVVFLIDDFEARKWQNLLGAGCGAWEKDPFDSSEFCRASFDRDLRANATSSVLRLHHAGGPALYEGYYSSLYDLDLLPSTSVGFVEDVRGAETTSVLRLQHAQRHTTYNGYFSNLYGMDLRPFTHLTFWVKRSAKYYPNTFKIELKTTRRIASYRLDFPTNEVEWVRVSIPFAEFENFGEPEEWKRTREMTIVFEGRLVNPLVGVVYFDDLGFSAPADHYERQIARIAQETADLKAEMRRISELPEEELLEFIQRKTFDFFWLESSPVTGLTKDRSVRYGAASTGATGFTLTAICIGIERGWISYEDGYRRALKTLKALRYATAQERGFWVHWVNAHTGQRDGRSEVSSVDSALCLGGVLTCREYFKEKEIKDLADEIFKAVEWAWMMGDDAESGLLYMGWAPEHGFKGFITWDMFAEEMLMYLLGLGSPTFPLPEKSWHSFARPVKTYGDQTYIYHDGECMFVYLYSHCWVDFRNTHDAYADYFKNTAAAVRSNKRFCQDNAEKSRTYREGFWGISASDGPRGYAAFAALFGMHDGTIPPYSACGALPFAPEICLPTIRQMLAEYGDRVWIDCGFVSAFNLDRNWFSIEAIGIDQGLILLGIENYRTGNVWKWFMKNPYIRAGMKRAGFERGSRELDVPHLDALQKKREETGLGTVYKKMDVAKAKKGIKIDGNLEEWAALERYDLENDKEYGEILGPTDFSAAFGFQWDGEHLYVAFDVTDDEIIAQEARKEIYRGDCIELYMDFITHGRNFIWGDNSNFQIGFAPNSLEKTAVAWSWFQDHDPKDEIEMAVARKPDGYVIEASIDWSLLKQKPEPDLIFGCSVAVHDLDSKTRAMDKKLNWCFKKVAGKIGLGELTLRE